MIPPALGLPAIFAFGLIIGSFINVVIARLPEKQSVVHPGSRCPRCLHPIAWHDNIPVLSYVLLRGRCRHCHAPISWRYPAVELLTALLFVLALSRIGFTLDLLIALGLIGALIAITGIDLDHQIIPDVVTLPGIVVGLVASLTGSRITVIESLLGVVIGGGIFFVIIVVSRGGMGGGDMKLGAMLGAFLGWKLALVAALLAVLAGGIVAIGLLLLRRKGRKDPVPFGPFLALGGTISLLWGEAILRWYLGAYLS